MDKITEQEAEKEWHDYSIDKAGYVNPCLASRETYSDVKTAIKEAIKKEMIPNYGRGYEESYNSALRKVLALIDQVKPKS